MDFSGRARRMEYWMFTLFNVIFFVAAMLIDTYFDLMVRDFPFGFISISYYIFIIIPSLAVTIRRLHDLGKSGWYYLISFIPFIGGIWILVHMCIEGENQTNKWGPNPKAIE